MSLRPRLPAHAGPSIDAFLRHHVREAPAEGVVVGLSGGIDSALAARLARDALGPERVLGVVLPDDGFPAALLDETRGYAETLGIRSRVVPIVSVIAALRPLLPGVDDRVTWGNVAARLRMIVLYTIAREDRRLVLGTGNKSEILLGYFTKFGDGGADLLPLGDLYKTQVRELAAQLGLPPAVRERAPSAGLWEGQTDEAELGLPYDQLDEILLGLEQLRTVPEIAEATGIPPAVVGPVVDRVARHRHKRQLPPIPKLGLRTVGLDWKD